MGALLSFLGGSVFRMLWGEISSFVSRWQEHKHELATMEAQGKLDAARHQQNQDSIRLQAELQVKQVQVAGDLAIQNTEANAFVEAIKAAAKPIGILWVDAWNGAVRPAMATIALAMWVLALYRAGFVPTDWDKELIAGILGFYIAERALSKRGK